MWSFASALYVLLYDSSLGCICKYWWFQYLPFWSASTPILCFLSIASSTSHYSMANLELNRNLHWEWEIRKYAITCKNYRSLTWKQGDRISLPSTTNAETNIHAGFKNDQLVLVTSSIASVRLREREICEITKIRFGKGSGTKLWITVQTASATMNTVKSNKSSRVRRSSKRNIFRWNKIHLGP